MKYSLLLALIVVICSFSCEESISPQDTFLIGDTVIINLGESKYNAEYEFGLTYQSKLGESRCPIDATCIWGGDVTVEVVYKTHTATETYELHTNEGDGTSRSFESEGHLVNLINVLPYPCVSCQNIRKEDEVIVLIVTNVKKN